MRRKGKHLTVVGLVGLIATAFALLSSSAATAEVQPNQDFESFALGSPGGQFGWQFSPGTHDAAIADPMVAFGVAGMGNRAFRISNASTNDAFGDWVFSQSLANDAGESGAESDGLSGGTRQSHFETSFDITSAVPNAEQPGLQSSLAPDRGDGARMSFLRFNDTPTGISVTFSDYVDRHTQGSVLGDSNGCSGPDNFVTTTIASGLARNAIHSVKLTMDFLPGPANDRVEVYIGGVLVHAGTSWEDYYRYCEGNATRPVDSLIFQARAGAGTAPGTLGKGFLFDNLTLASGPIVNPTTAGTWELYPPQGQNGYTTKVRPPINADGSSNWPAKRGVIPVQFDLFAATGPVRFESILSDNPGNTDNDFSYLKFAPTGNLAFTDLTHLVANYSWLLGDCHGGSLRWSVSLDTTGDGNSDGRVFIYYGAPTSFTDCTTIPQSGTNMIGFSDPRYDTTQLGGPFYDTYAGTLSSFGDARVLGASLVLDSGWAGDQRINLTGATANGTSFTPLPSGTPAKTCNLPPAKLTFSKLDGIPSGDVNEAESIQPKDSGVFYRQVDCKYIYNLDVSSLTGKGTYTVYVNINGNLADPATFDLR